MGKNPCVFFSVFANYSHAKFFFKTVFNLLFDITISTRCVPVTNSAAWNVPTKLRALRVWQNSAFHRGGVCQRHPCDPSHARINGHASCSGKFCCSSFLFITDAAWLWLLFGSEHRFVCHREACSNCLVHGTCSQRNKSFLMLHQTCGITLMRNALWWSS